LTFNTLGQVLQLQRDEAAAAKPSGKVRRPRKAWIPAGRRFEREYWYDHLSKGDLPGAEEQFFGPSKSAGGRHIRGWRTYCESAVNFQRPTELRLAEER
jgi:hypothetical protein